ncbi:MAG: glutamate--tRNA ligase [Chloroflexi bacterium]|nr:glutamate--tRNA ligase [Chloroflexota bacterium]
MANPVRVRFAPSPTGSLHIGGLRTALFNWLYARKHNGAFVLRIEDTDQKRYDPTALATLTEALRWAGLHWDEGPDVGGAFGPYVQSERLALYQQWAQWLVDNGKAYKCFCTTERLAQVNKDKEARKELPGYDRFCRRLTPAEVAEKEAQGLKPVIRMKMPLDGQTVVQDVLRGDVVFENQTQQDAVLLKSDGFPTYHLAHVVDDHFMQISHVMRANEWLPSAALHMQLWLAFGWEIPVYVHLPVMLNPNGKGKMSKRNPPKDKYGNIIPVMVHDYINAGYLPEALDNFLANIGWNFGEERELFTMAEAVERFDLARINPANSAFPTEKLDWLNGEHLRALPLDELARRLRPVLEKAGFSVDETLLQQVTPIVQTRLKTLNEVVAMAGFFFRAEFIPAAPDKLPQKKMDAASTRLALEQSISVLETLRDFGRETTHAAVEKLTETLGLNNSQLFGVLRTAVSGQQVSPPLFETMEIVGQAETLRRLRLALESLKTLAA